MPQPSTTLSAWRTKPNLFIGLHAYFQDCTWRLDVQTLDRPKSRPILAQAKFCGQAAFHDSYWKFRSKGKHFVAENRSSTHKRVVIRKLDKSLVKGFVDPHKFLSQDSVEILDLEGRLLHVLLDEIKGVFFVREFEGNPHRQERKVFHSRPRLGGLWVRLTFKDNEVMEGLMANNLLLLDPQGYQLTPADLYSNNLRVFIPRSALSGLEVLGVIADGAARRSVRKPVGAPATTADTSRQIGLFPPPNSSLG